MRILVLSDSHGSTGNILEAIEKHSDAEVVVFLGDGESDFDNAEYFLRDKRVIGVAGNCDFRSDKPFCEITTVGGKRIYCTHGHEERVKWGLGELISRARAEKADIVLYGHTHTPVNTYDDGLYIFNPGSLRDGSYGVIDITPSGVMPIHMKLWK